MAQLTTFANYDWHTQGPPWWFVSQGEGNPVFFDSGASTSGRLVFNQPSTNTKTYINGTGLTRDQFDNITWTTLTSIEHVTAGGTLLERVDNLGSVGANPSASAMRAGDAFNLVMAGDDTLIGSSGRQLLGGRDGDDTFIVGAGDWVATGPGGLGDIINGGAGVDTLRLDNAGTVTDTGGVACAGVEVLMFNSGSSRFIGLTTSHPIQTIIGGGLSAIVEIFDVTGGDFSHLTFQNWQNPNYRILIHYRSGGSVGTIIGTSQDDTIDQDGNPAASPTFQGGLGNDTYYVTNSGTRAVEASGQGTDTVYAAVNYTLEAGSHVEVLIANAGATGLTLTGNEIANLIIGGAGNDVLNGGAGDDMLYGGAGVDTAVFAGTLSAHAINWSGTSITLNSAAEGLDTTRSIERFQFADGTVTQDDGNAIVDDLFYYSRNLDVWNADADADAHYAAFGFKEGRDPNAFFSTNSYFSANGDVKAADVNPLEHYHLFGWQEGRDASASFDTELYLLFNLDVAAANVDPLEHFLQFGREEGRAAHAAVGRNIQAATFDPNFYLLANPDVGFAGADPLAHYNAFGRLEGRDPNAYFDTSAYLATYADVAAAGVNPLEHYFQFGWLEGRDPSGAFDTDAYLAANADVAAAGVNPLEHFLKFGIYESRSAFGDGVIA